MTSKLVEDINRISEGSQDFLENMRILWSAIREGIDVPRESKQMYGNIVQRLERFYDLTLENFTRGDIPNSQYTQAVSQVDSFFGYTPKP